MAVELNWHFNNDGYVLFLFNWYFDKFFDLDIISSCEMCYPLDLDEPIHDSLLHYFHWDFIDLSHNLHVLSINNICVAVISQSMNIRMIGGMKSSLRY